MGSRWRSSVYCFVVEVAVGTTIEQRVKTYVFAFILQVCRPIGAHVFVKCNLQLLTQECSG